MQWKHLQDLIQSKSNDDPNFLDEYVYVWDVSTGDFCAADVCDHFESLFIDPSSLFISIRED